MTAGARRPKLSRPRSLSPLTSTIQSKSPTSLPQAKRTPKVLTLSLANIPEKHARFRPIQWTCFRVVDPACLEPRRLGEGCLQPDATLLDEIIRHLPILSTQLAHLSRRLVQEVWLHNLRGDLAREEAFRSSLKVRHDDVFVLVASCVRTQPIDCSTYSPTID